MDIAISVLVPCVPERLSLLPRLLGELTRQAEGRPVEVLALMDNRRRSTGRKMNDLVALAQGRYVTIVADDDWVEPDYVASLLAAIEATPDADCVMFDVAFYANGEYVKDFRYGQEYGWHETADCIYRQPAPFLCWSRKLMLRHPFPDKVSGEDSDWMATGPWLERPLRQARIARVLYRYLAVPGHP